MSITFSLRPAEGHLYVDLYASTAGPGSVSFDASFSYTASQLTFDNILVWGSSALSTSSSVTWSSGSVTISGTLEARPASEGPFATLVFSGSGSGLFNLDIASLALAGVAQYFSDPAPIAFSIELPRLEISLDEDTSFTGVFAGAGPDAGRELRLDVAPQHGTVSLHANALGVPGGWTYTPSPDYYGEDRFTIAVLGDVETSRFELVAHVESVVDMVYGTAGQDQMVDMTGDAYLLALGGDDTIIGGDGDDLIDGGDGIDTAVFNTIEAAYVIASAGPGFNVWTTTNEVEWDVLVNVERLVLPYGKVALDVSGAAGMTALVLGAAFGLPALANPAWVGIGLGLFDSGRSLREVCQFAIDVGFGGLGDLEFVSAVYGNVVGAAPSQAVLHAFVELLATGGETRAALLELATQSDANRSHVDLVGLAQTGIGYV